MSTIGKLVPVVLFAFFIMIAMTYGLGIMSSADDNMNVSSEYQDQFNHSVGVQIATFNIMNTIGILVGVFGLVIVIWGLYKRQ